MEERREAPLESKNVSAIAETEALEKVKHSLNGLLTIIHKLDTTKGTARKINEAAEAVFDLLEKFTDVRLSRICGPAPAQAFKTATADALPEMVVTPEWWVPTKSVALKGANVSMATMKATSKLRPRRIKPFVVPDTDTEREPFNSFVRKGCGTDFAIDARRRGRRPLYGRHKKDEEWVCNGIVTKIAAAKHLPVKTPVVLVKARESATYVDIVRAVKLTVNSAELGVNISKMRKTRNGHLLLEIKSEDKSLTEVGVLKDAVVSMVFGPTAAVAQLGGWAELEVWDLDPTVDEAEVRMTLQDTILCGRDDFSSASSKGMVDISDMWARRRAHR